MSDAALLAEARCQCGSGDIFAIHPGIEAVRRGAVDLFTRLDPIVDHGEADACWCFMCWARHFMGRPT